MTTPINQTPTDSKYLEMDLLRFITCGSVDDGKSTLIGRLLYDSKSIFEDQWQAIETHSEKSGNERVNLALLTDGLRAEREQGITIDVAYRYFATPKRKFIIADTPGHVQYTRNMVTGASTVDLAVLLVDARTGILEQTCRHAYIASLLQIKHVILCINKMDLVDYKQEVYEDIVKKFEDISSKLDIADIRFIPMNALDGDNVVKPSKKMPWYNGSTLLHTLENLHISSDLNHEDSRFPVQYVIRPQSKDYPDFRGYAGRVESGVFHVGDEITHHPSGFSTKIKEIVDYGAQLDIAFPPMSITMVLEENLDISRGDLITKKSDSIHQSQDIEAMVCWLNPTELKPQGKYVIRHSTKETRGLISNIHYKININTYEENKDDTKISLNDIGRITIRTTEPLFYDSYRQNRSLGSIIIIDPFTFETVGAAMII